jgi:hypothetical protein
MTWFQVSTGLLREGKHRKRIGPALWEFLWMIEQERKPKDGETPSGVLCGGNPVPASRIAGDLGTHVNNVLKNLARLERENYIRSECVQGRASRYFICNSKRWQMAATKPASASAPKLTKPETDPRHNPIQKQITSLWIAKNPNVPTAPWDGREAGTLAQFLKSRKQWTVDTILACINHRFQSDTNHSERPALWLPKLESYLSGPLDQYNKLKNGTNGKPPQPMVNLLEESRKAGIVP